ncbi:PH domain-containing protein [Pseudoalteromonas sp. YIC-656]|uniref:PH domain-containing protein n=1 Tax=Pseudoalteromonas pernae TaxID=3118054 RepID=UPI003242D076
MALHKSKASHYVMLLGKLIVTTISNELRQDTWHRLSPWAILYFILTFGYRFIFNGLLNLLPVVVVFIVNVERKLFWGSLAIAAGLLFLVAFGVAYYLTFRFRISSDGRLHVHKGVFTKERLVLRFGRIQNINLTTPIYFAPFARTNCQVDAAGSSGNEIVLPALAVEAAQQMRSYILAAKEGHIEPQLEQETSSESDASPYLTLSNGEVAKFGLMSNMALLALATMMPVINMLDEVFSAYLVDPLEAFFADQAAVAVHASMLTIAVLVFAAVFVTVGASVIMSLLRFFNFEFYVEAERFRRVAGLLERQQLTMRFNKVQTITLKQNWVGVLLKRFTLEIAQVATNKVPQKASKDKQSLLLPVLTQAQSEDVIHTLYPWFDLTKLTFNGVSKRYLWHRIWLFGVLPIGVITGVLVALNGWQFAAVLLGGVPLCCYHFYVYKRLGWQLVEHDGRVFLWHRQGLVGCRYSVCELYKGQQVHVTQTPLMVRANVASVSIQMASKSLHLPFMPMADATLLADHILYQMESNQQAWF